MPLNIITNDITKMQVDAIVNTANTELLMGGGLCGAIFNAAGPARLEAACGKLAPIRTGEAVATEGFDLPVKYIIHTAGPIYRGGNHGEEALLRSSYINSLELAKNLNCVSVAFPLISSGIYAYPKDEALGVATSVIGDWLANNDMDITLVMFDKAAFKLSLELRGNVQSFIDENYDGGRGMALRKMLTPSMALPSMPPPSMPPSMPSPTSLAFKQTSDMHGADYAQSIVFEHKAKPIHLDEPFSATLLRLIDLKGKTDVEIYKRANIDRKLFSKIRSGKAGYMPSKKTIVALAVALELSLPEARDLLERAGFALSRSVVFDVIIEYFLSNRRYDIYEINNVLFEYDQPLLGG